MPPKPYDITMQKFGRLTPISLDRERMQEYAERTGFHRTYWNCKCDCGKMKSISYHSLSNGYTKSCGCLRKGIKLC